MHYADVAFIQPTVIAYNLTIKSNFILFSRVRDTTHLHHRIIHHNITLLLNALMSRHWPRPGSVTEWEIVVAQHARLVVSGNLYKFTPFHLYDIFL